MGSPSEKTGVLLQKGNQAIWRFEAFITGLTYASPLGPLGQVEVEANTGQGLNNQPSAQAMSERGRTKPASTGGLWVRG